MYCPDEIRFCASAVPGQAAFVVRFWSYAASAHVHCSYCITVVFASLRRYGRVPGMVLESRCARGQSRGTLAATCPHMQCCGSQQGSNALHCPAPPRHAHPLLLRFGALIPALPGLALSPGGQPFVAYTCMPCSGDILGGSNRPRAEDVFPSSSKSWDKVRLGTRVLGPGVYNYVLSYNMCRAPAKGLASIVIMASALSYSVARQVCAAVNQREIGRMKAPRTYHPIGIPSVERLEAALILSARPWSWSFTRETVLASRCEQLQRSNLLQERYRHICWLRGCGSGPQL